jgi:hypothetical protein
MSQTQRVWCIAKQNHVLLGLAFVPQRGQSRLFTSCLLAGSDKWPAAKKLFPFRHTLFGQGGIFIVSQL